ncbi:hypothetical protein K493DRAFT_367750 [Basidiobolus meristosporus CBS 931.73]|uniref:SCP domain-containing protein n=1 Tax=Basidiobolus meristosporus CBS 931.73 TaxID=1314790 RepID=A0A1Y1YK27_9FUNG|nr:hypothetical protein K493DRAFT_367750 [Basidiobolus meristosporus CBS 931.73]|eukprot:ORX98349.1 hypothetical protein K493DRAFT_367750 [Basidiobolus meristosporus CBS 931.73]
MQPSFLLLVSAIASLQAISATPLGGSHAPSQEHQPSIEEVDDSEMSGPMQTSQTSGEQPGLSGFQGLDISNLPPSQALLDNINGHSSSKANALSNSNQFDQAQVIDQTLYRPKQQQPQIIITQPAACALRGGYKKYKRSARHHFKDTRISTSILQKIMYANDYYQNVRVLPVFKTPNVQSPLLRQVFTTVTRKHDSLNIANANSNKGFSVKYQAGAGLELEGRGNALEYAKQNDCSSFSPYVLMQPTQDVQYTTSVTETQCVKEQNIQ